MDSRKTAGVSGVQKLQQVECLSPAYLTEDDSVRPMAKGCLQKIPDRHCRQAVLRLPGFQANQILLPHLNLGGVLDQQDSFVLGDELPDDVQKRRFATPSSASNKDVFPCQDIILKLVRKPSF